MKCLILAAGYATRLYPLTENFPKPLLKVLNKPIMDWLIDDLEETGKIDEYYVVSNHKFVGHFEEWKKTKQAKISIIDDGTTSNETRLGAVSDMELAIEQFEIDDDLMVLAGDNVVDFSLGLFIKHFEEKKKSCIMSYYEEDLNKMKKHANLILDENDRVIDMVEKPEIPKSHICSPALYIFCKDDVKKVKEAIDNGCSVDAPGSFINYLYQKSDVYAYKMPGHRYDIGNLETYENVNRVYKGIEIRDNEKTQEEER